MRVHDSPRADGAQPELEAPRVEFSAKTLNRLRDEVVRAYARGGTEGLDAGGVLFGFSEPGLVHVEEFRTMVLTPGRREGEWQTCGPVGWFRAHTGADFNLRHSERKLFDKYFPEPGSIALILGVENAMSVNAGIFVRMQDGSVGQYCGPNGPSSVVGAIESAEAEGQTEEATPPARQWSGVPGRRDWEGRLKRWLPWTLVGALAIAGGWYWFTGQPVVRPAETKPPVEPLSAISLSMVPQGSAMVLHWNGGPKTVQSAQLEIQDGPSLTGIDLSAEYRPDGIVMVFPDAKNVDAVLRVSNGGETVERHASAENPQAKAAAVTPEPIAEPAPKPDKNLKKSERAELQHLRVQNRRLEALAAELRRRARLGRTE